MADVQIEASTYILIHGRSVRSGPVWTDEDTAYIVYEDANEDLVYRKTANGGVDWGAAVGIRTGTIQGDSIWFDKWTPGDSGDLIHIAYIDSDADDVLYRNLDTSTDTLGAEKTIFAGTSAQPGGWTTHSIDITKSRGGYLYCGFWIDADGENGFCRSIDDGDNWVARTTMADGNAVDLILLAPGDETDNQDIWCIYWDASATELTLKTYDNSGNDWTTTAETSISLNMTPENLYFQMSAAQRASDNHVILAAWSQLNNAASDLMVWDIGGAASIVAKLDVLTDTVEAAQCAVFINQQTDDIYVAYLKGDADGWENEVGAFYKKSDDGGGSWGNEVKLSDDADDDLKAIWVGHSVGDEGGYFMPAWFNDDLNDLLTSTANAVTIAAAAGATVNVIAVTAEATAAALLPTISVVRLVDVSAVTAEATADALLPTISTGVNVDVIAVTAEASAAALLPAISVVRLVDVSAVTAEATAAALLPSVAISKNILAVTAEATAAALLPTISVVRLVDVSAVTAEATAAALPPTISLIIYDQFGEIVASINPNDYPTGTSLKLLVVIRTSNAAKPVYARLYNVTDDVAESESIVNTDSTSAVEVVSGALSLPSGDKTYRIEIGGLAGGTYHCAKAVVRGTV